MVKVAVWLRHWKLAVSTKAFEISGAEARLTADKDLVLAWMVFASYEEKFRKMCKA